MPTEFGINIAVSPGVENIEQQERDVLDSLAYFLDAGVHPTWFTLNLSCPNTEDDPLGHQLEDETKRLCGTFITILRKRGLDIPLWVKISPGLSCEQAGSLMRIFQEVGVQAVIATNTLAKAVPGDERLRAGVGGGALFDEALVVVEHLRSAQTRHGSTVDIIGCGGILDGESLRVYEERGVGAAQYWSALVYRGPFAAAMIESEVAEYEAKFEAVHRESLA